MNFKGELSGIESRIKPQEDSLEKEYTYNLGKCLDYLDEIYTQKKSSLKSVEKRNDVFLKALMEKFPTISIDMFGLFLDQWKKRNGLEE